MIRYGSCLADGIVACGRIRWRAECARYKQIPDGHTHKTPVLLVVHTNHPPPDTPLNERVTYRTHVVTDHHGPQPVLDGPVPNLLSHSPDGTCVRHPSL